MGTLDVKTGQITGLPQSTPKPPDVGMPMEQLIGQVYELAKKKVPIEKVIQAIEQHPDIKDKGAAKEIATANYPKPELSQFVGK